MSPWLALLVLTGVVLGGCGLALWALLAAASGAEREWHRYVHGDDEDEA